MRDLQKQIERIIELAGKHTKGDWFWSARTLRSEIREIDEDGDEFVIEIPDILNVDGDRCIFGKGDDMDLIALVPEMVDIILALQQQIKELTTYAPPIFEAQLTNDRTLTITRPKLTGKSLVGAYIIKTWEGDNYTHVKIHVSGRFFMQNDCTTLVVALPRIPDITHAFLDIDDVKEVADALPKEGK
jgi:hypothetical protein